MDANASGGWSMSRSRKKHPVVPTKTVASEKVDKRLAHQAERHAVKVALLTGREVLPDLREVSDVWVMAKTGKHWVDPREHPEALRK
jgi:hypothetical protein